MFNIELLSGIMAILDKEYDFGLDIRLLRETIDRANKRLEETGVFIKVLNTGNGFVQKDKTVVTFADVMLIFFNPYKKREQEYIPPDLLRNAPDYISLFGKYEPGILADRLGIVLDDASRILGEMRIGLELGTQMSVISFIDSPKIISVNTKIVFKNKEA